MVLPLGLASLFFLTTCFLLFSRAERTRSIIELRNEVTESRREASTVTRKLEEAQGRYGTAKSELSQIQREYKELKQQLHVARQKKSGTPTGTESSDPSDMALRRAEARVEELEAQLKAELSRLRAFRDRAESLENKEKATIAEQVARIAASTGGVSEDAHNQAVESARREAATAARVALKDELRGEVETIKTVARTERRERAAAAASARKLQRRYEDAHRAYHITQGQLEMAHDRIFFLETGTHRRAHRADSIPLAEMAVNARGRAAAANGDVSEPPTDPSQKVLVDDAPVDVEGVEEPIEVGIEEVPDSAFESGRDPVEEEAVSG